MWPCGSFPAESMWKTASTSSAGCRSYSCFGIWRSLILHLAENGDGQACRTMNVDPGVVAEALSESMDFVTPLTSTVHCGLWDSFNNLLDSSEDAMGQEVSKDAKESIYVAWEGSQEERKVWLRGQCNTILRA